MGADAVPAGHPGATRWLHALHLYGAAAVTAFGWAMCALLGWDAAPWVPLWGCGALLVYNVDRLKRDAADALNVPQRARAAQRWRAASRAVAAVAAVPLLGLPAWRGDWLTLGLVVAGTGVALGYSLPRRGVRIKDVPVLKTLFAPSVVAAAIFTLPVLHGAAVRPHGRLAAVIVWAWLFLCANMLLCDLRDVAGDRLTGVRSVPVLLGEAGTRRLVGVFAGIGGALAVGLAAVSAHPFAWILLAALGPAALAVLLVATREPREEGFYEWWVEGIFFLPALALGAEWLLGRAF